MPILPLPQFEADMEADRRDREIYARLKAPSSIVVRFGVMKLVGEFPYSGDAKPGCGSKIVVRTHRGVEIGEMLTSTCPNSGCSKSVSRQEMLEYIENSGGRDYPFFTDGRVLRIATAQDLAEQSRIDALRPSMVRTARGVVAALGLPLKIVEAEPILGAERLAFYFTSEERIDFRDLVHELSAQFSARIELRQVGARDEARLVADYERCGQHCCCKQFLKVLKPISIKAAKTQKATLDPLKISGRCGRLMCCLRYEDETYTDLIKRLPKLRKAVGTPFGAGVVIDRQVLTQLVLVRLDHDRKDVAIPVEDLMAPEDAPLPGSVPKPSASPSDSGADPLRGMPEARVERRIRGDRPSPQSGGAPDAPPRDRQQRHQQRVHRDAPQGRRREPDAAPQEGVEPPGFPSGQPEAGPQDPRRKRRRRRSGEGRGPDGGGGSPSSDAGQAPGSESGFQPSAEGAGAGASGEGGAEGVRRKRRRRRRPGRGSGESGGGSHPPEGGGGAGGGGSGPGE